MDPLTGGDYPFIMRTLLGDRLPRFTAEESRLIKGSFDFIGLNYYTANYAYGLPLQNRRSELHDRFFCQQHRAGVRNGVPIGPQVTQITSLLCWLAVGSPGESVQAASGWLYVYPKGIRDLLLYTKSKYNNPVIYITENGRIHLLCLLIQYRLNYSHGEDGLASRKGADVRGFFMWTLLDDFEWNSGYTVRFGLHYVDFKDGLKRYPKRSALWFREFLRRS
ncbi:beta-glucosidase [Musa troglodytarum]|uniref:Beta-glucosidase n=1 Tax=Musa troglodytarum TaxID=320322 RepID=A0A9E7H1H6_9LILI|nr:beta-glucosidase [Musa troglodytarum]